MADNDAVPKRAALWSATFEALRKLGGSGTVGELLEHVITDRSISAEVLRLRHLDTEQSELEYRMAWARTDLKIAGLITRSGHGVWAFTAAGAQLEKLVESDIARTLRELRRDGIPSDTNGNGGGKSLETQEESWRESLMKTLLALKPDAFERLAQRLLREAGFSQVEVTGRSGDGGIDGHGIVRISGLLSFPVLFQCKRWKGSVPAGAVRDFRGAMVGRTDKGLLITTGVFTLEARREATRDGAPPIDLIDGQQLVDKLRELSLGVSVLVRTYEETVVDTEWFESL